MSHIVVYPPTGHPLFSVCSPIEWPSSLQSLPTAEAFVPRDALPPTPSIRESPFSSSSSLDESTAHPCRPYPLFAMLRVLPIVYPNKLVI